MKLSVYVATTIKTDFPSHDAYRPIFLGESALTAPEGYLTDNTGENISTKNKLYCELTALYWVWKHDTDSDWIGLCHYRRYFVFDTAAYARNAEELDVLTNPNKIIPLLSQCDVILPKKVYHRQNEHDIYVKGHREQDLQAITDIINKYYPEYNAALTEIMEGKSLYCGNLFVMKRANFLAYMAWLFDIMDKLERRIYVPLDDKYQRRLFGFLAERMLNVYVRHHRLKIKELPIYQCKNLCTDVSGDKLKSIKEALLYIIGLTARKTPVFLGDVTNMVEVARNFYLTAEDYIVAHDDKGVIQAETIRRLAHKERVLIFFTAAYEVIKEFLQSEGWQENVDFMDGRTLMRV